MRDTGQSKREGVREAIVPAPKGVFWRKAFKGHTWSSYKGSRPHHKGYKSRGRDVARSRETRVHVPPSCSSSSHANSQSSGRDGLALPTKRYTAILNKVKILWDIL